MLRELGADFVASVAAHVANQPGFAVDCKGLRRLLRGWPGFQECKCERRARQIALLNSIRATKRDGLGHSGNDIAIGSSLFSVTIRSHHSCEAAHEASPDISSANAA